MWDIDELPQDTVRVPALVYYHREQGFAPRPTAIWWQDEKLAVKLISARSGVSAKVKKMGIEYDCLISGRHTQLYYDLDTWICSVRLRPSMEPVTDERLNEHIIVRYESEYKQYVPVLAYCHKDGGWPEPVTIYWPDGRQFNVQDIISMDRAASQKAGGIGIQYCCAFGSQSAMIWHEDHTRSWFVERKEPRQCVEGTI